MTTATETAPVVAFSQILDGTETCEHCNEQAAVMLSTGADPEPEPYCWPAARQMVQAAISVMDTITGKDG